MSTLAWHFVGDKLRDGRPVPADGEWLVHTGKVVMCESGLHASLDPFDALTYAPGNILCRVKCHDIVDSEHDKLVCRRRSIIRRADMTELLRSYAQWCALGEGNMAVGSIHAVVAANAAFAAADRAFSAKGAELAAINARAASVGRLAEADARDAAWLDARAAQRAEFNRRVQEVFQ